MITSERLEEIEAAATTQPGAETSTLLEYTDGAVPDLVLELVGEIRQQRWMTSAPTTAFDAQPDNRGTPTVFVDAPDDGDRESW